MINIKMRKHIQVIARSFSTTKPDVFKAQEINVKTFEYEPFKFGIERQAMIHGYTMEEMYGRYSVRDCKILWYQTLTTD